MSDITHLHFAYEVITGANPNEGLEPGYSTGAVPDSIVVITGANPNEGLELQAALAGARIVATVITGANPNEGLELYRAPALCANGKRHNRREPE